MDTREQIAQKIEEEGVKYTSRTWQLLKARGKPLTLEESDDYVLVQKAHVELTGYSLPPLPGARKTRAQVRNQDLPPVSEEVIEQAVAGGLAARLAKMREK